MAHYVVCPQKKIISRIFKISGALIVNLHLTLPVKRIFYSEPYWREALLLQLLRQVLHPELPPENAREEEARARGCRALRASVRRMLADLLGPGLAGEAPHAAPQRETAHLSTLSEGLRAEVPLDDPHGAAHGSEAAPVHELREELHHPRPSQESQPAAHGREEGVSVRAVQQPVLWLP
jgi:hypothetical protein